jgi:DNA polymerase III delta subunit
VLTDAWGQRDLPVLLDACELALERNKEPFLLAVNLASHVGRVRAAQAMAEEGLGARDIAARLKIKEFPARKALQHSERYSRAELDAALVRLAELDAAIKGASRLSSELELLRALIDVTRPVEQPVATG